MTELIARRAFSPVYIGLDTAFLLLFAALLLWKRRYMTVVVGGLAGILYMLVDYGIFHLLCGAQIVIERPTGAYHGYMALLLFVGYLGVILYNLWQGRPECRVSIPWILAIGVLVQFGWEAGLLIGGIRSAGFPSLAEKLRPLIVNSLLETNLGMPYMYLIFIAYSSRFTEDLHRRKTPLALVERIAEYIGGKNA